MGGGGGGVESKREKEGMIEADRDTDTDTWFIVKATDPFTTRKEKLRGKRGGGGGAIFSLDLHS